MFSFFKRKKTPAPGEAPPSAPEVEAPQEAPPPAEPAPAGSPAPEAPAVPQDAPVPVPAPTGGEPQAPVAGPPPAAPPAEPVSSAGAAPPPAPAPVPAASAMTEAAAPIQEAPSVAPVPPAGVQAAAPALPAEPEAAAPPVPPAAPDPAPAGSAPSAATAERPRASWMARLKQGLARTGQSLGGLFTASKVDDAWFDDLETALIMADVGVEATTSLMTALRARVRKARLSEVGQVKQALRELLTEHLAPLEKAFPLGKASPLVVMIAGVNGAGKTTSIGKLAHAFQAQGASVLLAAGDTFRAAAREQLIAWGERNGVTVIAQDGGDPAAVAFDAVNAGKARGAGVVMVDTAGRLPTQQHLMAELKKIRRVVGKADEAAPHEVLLVVDGNTGQNALAQIRAFDAAVDLTGLVVTKLDGTAKGGVLAAMAAGSQGVRPVPVYWIGVGEGMDDLQPFVAAEFAAALLGD